MADQATNSLLKFGFSKSGTAKKQTKKGVGVNQPGSAEAKDTKYDKHKRERKFQTSWKTTYPWLDYIPTEGTMCCTLCQKYPLLADQSSVLYKGCSNMRVEPLKHHSVSKQHIACFQQMQRENEESHFKDMMSSSLFIGGPRKQPAPILSAFVKLQKQTQEKYTHIFNTTYMLAKNNKPLSDIEMQITLLEKCGVQVGNKDHLNRYAARQFVTSIVHTLGDDIKKAVSETKFISVISDGSTDRAIIEQESVLVRYVHRGEVVTSFVNVVELETVDGLGVYSGITKALEGLGLNFDFLGKASSPGPVIVSTNFDGAAVMQGSVKGVATLFQKNIAKHIQPVWCVAHRLELAVLDTVKEDNKLQNLEKIIKWIFTFYDKYNAKNRREAKAIASVLEEEFVYLPPIHEVRWVASKLRVDKALIKDLHVVATHLENVAAGKAGYKVQSEKAVKANTYLKEILQVQFLKTLYFFTDVHEEITKLSKFFQRDDVLIFEVDQMVDACIMALMNMKNNPGKTMQKFLTNYQPSDSTFITHCGATLKLSQGGGGRSRSAWKSGPDNDSSVPLYPDDSLTGLLNEMISYIESRLKNFKEPPFKCFGFFNYNLYPSALEDLAQHGNEDLEQLLEHYKEAVGEDLVAEAKVQFQIFKVHLAKYKGQNPHLIFKYLLKTCFDLDVQSSQQAESHCQADEEQVPAIFNSFRAMLVILELMMTVSHSTAKAERSFSRMNLLKTPQRQTMTQDLLQELMVISMEGPSVKDYNPQNAIEHWLNAGVRNRYNFNYRTPVPCPDSGRSPCNDTGKTNSMLQSHVTKHSDVSVVHYIE